MEIAKHDIYVLNEGSTCSLDGTNLELQPYDCCVNVTSTDYSGLGHGVFVVSFMPIHSVSASGLYDLDYCGQITFHKLFGSWSKNGEESYIVESYTGLIIQTAVQCVINKISETDNPVILL